MAEKQLLLREMEARKQIPPLEERELLEIRTIPKLTDAFEKKIAELEDCIKQEVFRRLKRLDKTTYADFEPELAEDFIQADLATIRRFLEAGYKKRYGKLKLLFQSI